MLWTLDKVEKQLLLKSELHVEGRKVELGIVLGPSNCFGTELTKHDQNLRTIVVTYFG